MKAEELLRAADRNNMNGFFKRLKEVWGPVKKGLEIKRRKPSLTARALWQDEVNTSRSYSMSMAT
jgi:hypothetical protein